MILCFISFGPFENSVIHESRHGELPRDGWVIRIHITYNSSRSAFSFDKADEPVAIRDMIIVEGEQLIDQFA
jgi:hypothetical protein